MKHISIRRITIVIAAAACLTVPATAQADSDAAQLPGARTEAPATPMFPPADFRGGDNPADHPGMSRAPRYDSPTTIEVVRPERTIVRDVDEALPLILSSTALLVVLAALAGTLVRGRLVPRPGRSS